MPREAAQLLHEALESPGEERAALADSLLGSLDSDVDAETERAWREENERRTASIDTGTTKLVPWDNVYARLNERLQHRTAPG